MQNFNRRRFLQTASVVTSTAALPDGQIGSMIERLAIAEPVSASTIGTSTSIRAALNGAAEAFSTLFRGYDPFDKFFGYKAKPATADEFFSELSANIEFLFQRSSTIAQHIRVLQENKEAASSELNTAWKEFDVWDAWHYVVDRRLTGHTLIRWIDDAALSADEKMADLRKYYDGRGPSPFVEGSLVDWDQPPTEALASLRKIIVQLDSRLKDKPARIAADLISEEEERLFGSLWSYAIQGLAEPVFNRMYDDIGKRFDALSERYGISKDALWYFKRGRNFNMYSFNNDEKGISLSLDETPLQILEKTQNAANEIVHMYGERNNPWTLESTPNRTFYNEVRQRLPSFVQEIVPRFSSQYFPEEWARLVEKEAQQSNDNQPDLKPSKEMKALELSPRAILADLLDQEFGNRMWTDRHIGRLPVKICPTI